MQVKELKSEGLSHELEVTVSAKEIDKQIDARLKEVGKTMKLPGFRPGKVPMALLKQRYSRAVLGEVLETTVNETTQQALNDKGLRPALQPKIEVKQFDEGKDLTYTLSVEVLPDFKVMDLKGLSVEKPVASVEAKAIDEALERIASGNRETVKVETSRATKKGDTIVIDFKGRTKDDNVEKAGMAGNGHKLELGSNSFIPGFEDQLIGKKAGETVDVEVTFPTPYHSADLEGRVAIFTTTIHEIHESKESVIDDEFAKKLGLDNVDSLRKAVEEQIQKEYDQFSRLKLKRALLDALDEGHDFPVPAGMLEMEFGSILQQIKNERQASGETAEVKIEKDEEEELKAIAERRVRLGMILSEIGRTNNIQVSDVELQRAVISEAQKYPGQEAQVFEFFRKNRQALESLRAPVYEDKVVDFITQLAAVKEKKISIEELTAEEEDESYIDKKKDKKPSTKKAAAKKDEGEEKAPAKKAAKK